MAGAVVQHVAGLCLLSCTLGMSCQQGTGKSAPGFVYLPMGAHLDEGNTSRERQSGGAGAALPEAGHLFLTEET